MVWHGETIEIEGTGNGRLDALCHALEERLGIRVANLTYKEHALEVGSGSRAVAYISVDDEDGNTHFGCGVDTDIMEASAKALVSAVNRMLAHRPEMAVPISKWNAGPGREAGASIRCAQSNGVERCRDGRGSP